MKFEDYHIEPSIKAQLEVLGFKRPTDIQFKTIGHVLAGEDVMAVAQTGTGKTAAYAIPIIDMIVKNKRTGVRGVQCLVLVPTRELSKQIANVFREIGKQSKIKAFGLFGGVEQEQQIRTLDNGIDVLVSTPGRMFDLISQGHLDISRINHLVLDESDLMLDRGFSKDIFDVKMKLRRKHQTLFFSATISKEIKKVAYKMVKDAIRIQISPKNPVAKNITHALIRVEMDDKRFFLENILKEYPEQKVLVFTRTKVRAERVLAAMNRVGLEGDVLHGGVEQDDRFAIIEKFEKGLIRLLITTDVAARGIDIPDVEYVINYDLPDNPENYVHRCGRTGRGKKLGQALSFCSSTEEDLLDNIQSYTGQEIEEYDISKSDYRAILEDTDDATDDWQSLIDKFSTDEWDD